MSRRNNSTLTLTAMTRILLRRRRAALVSLACLLPGTLVVAALWPLRYEAQLVVERRVSKVSPEPHMQEFDMTRLTSDTQRNVTLLKSRFMMDRWLTADGQGDLKDMARERALKKLRRALSVQPVNFTDLTVLKVRAASPERAEQLASELGQVYADWDTDQDRLQATEMIRLLDSRITQVKEELIALRQQLKKYKTTGLVSLVGSDAVAGTETELIAKEKLYDSLTAELDQAQREIQPESLRRVRLVNPPIASRKPVHPERF